MPCVECSDTMEFSKEMKEVKEFLVSNTYPEHLENDKGKKQILGESVGLSSSKTTV